MKDKVLLDYIAIIKIVCSYFKTDVEELNVRCRKREILKPRQICHYFGRKFTENTLDEIGGPYGHATVLHSNKVVNNEIDTNSEYREIIEEIEYNIIMYGLNHSIDFRLNKIKKSLISDIRSAYDTKELINILLKESESITNDIEVNYIKIA